MRKRFRSVFGSDAGFSMLELLVVLAILAMVGGLALRLALGTPAGLFFDGHGSGHCG